MATVWHSVMALGCIFRGQNFRYFAAQRYCGVIASSRRGQRSVYGFKSYQITGANYCFTSKLVDGAYPDYDRVVPKGGDKKVVGDREQLKQAFSRAAILSNEKYRGVRIQFQEGAMHMVANNPEQEEAQEEVAVSYAGESLEIGFNVSYLLDVFNVLKGSNIRFILSDSNSSALLEEDSDSSGALYVVMPMRL